MVGPIDVSRGFSRDCMRFACSALLAVLLVAAVFMLGGCAQENSEDAAGQSDVVAPPEPDAAEESIGRKVADQYRFALENVQNYFSDMDASLAGSASYSYALVDMDGVEAPLLLVRASGPADTWNGTETVKVLAYDAAADAPVLYEGSLNQGIAGAGGYRGSISASGSGDGILNTEISSGTGDIVTYRVMPDKATGALSRTIAYRGTLSSDSACDDLLSSEEREIAWAPVDDAAALEGLADGSCVSTADAIDTDWKAQAESAGLALFEGTLRVLDSDGLSVLQGKPDPNAGYKSDATYVVLVFDAPSMLSANSGDGSGMRESQATMISLQPAGGASGMALPVWYPEDWSALDGTKTVVAAPANKLWWPSDTGLPLGEPRVNDFVVLPS